MCQSQFLINLLASRPETSLKRDCSKIFSCEFCLSFQKVLFSEHLWLTLLADSSVPTKVLFIEHSFFFFCLFFFLFLFGNCNYGNLLRKGIKIKIFLLFTIIYPKINIKVVRTILPWQQFADAPQKKHRFPSAKASAIAKCRGEFQRVQCPLVLCAMIICLYQTLIKEIYNIYFCDHGIDS